MKVSFKNSLTTKITIIASLAMLIAMTTGVIVTSVIHHTLVNEYNNKRITLAVHQKSKLIDDTLLSIENVTKEIQILATSSIHKEDLINHAERLKQMEH